LDLELIFMLYILLLLLLLVTANRLDAQLETLPKKNDTKNTITTFTTQQPLHREHPNTQATTTEHWSE
jgi:hypothetical protein